MAQVKISELTAKGSALQATDLLEISQLVGSAYVSKSVNGGDIIDAAQSGMQSELISGTNIKTINSSSILGSGDLLVGTVTSVGLTTDALGTDVSVSGSPITGSGSITLSIPTASALNTGKLSKTDWTTFNNKQDALVSGTNIKTINGNSLLGSGDLVISGGGGLTIGTTAITSGTIGRVLFQGTGNVLQQSSNLFWDNTNGRLGIGTASPSQTLHIIGTFRASGGTQTGAIYGAGTNFNLGSDAYIQCTGTTGKNSGLTINRFSTSEYASVDLITNASFVSGWSIQMVPTSTRLDVVDRNPADNVRMTFHNGGNIGIGTTTNAGYKLDVNGSSRFLDKVSIGSPTAASAVLEISSTIQGFLPPRMTTTQKNAISSPAAGLVVYDTTLNKLCVRTASTWETITSA